MKVCAIGFILVLTVSVLTATSALAQSGESAYDFVSKVNVGDDNYLYINVIGNFSSSHGCPQPFFARSKYQLNDERTKAWMQMALASFLSRNKVYVWTGGCTPYGYPIMEKLQLQQE